MPVSFTQLRLVSQDELNRRLETVKVLQDNDTEMYRLAKDTETGEHYVHYAVYHLNVAGGAVEEEYHHLLPLEHDDVIALALGADLYVYPQHWARAYLRNGPNGGFVWYDPAGAAAEEQTYDEAAAYIREKLLTFRSQGGAHSEEDIKRLLDEMDKGLPPRGDAE
ncbi:hypothetical protein SD71_16920 [Cohnella kolymensis]|uniref:Uncharacterized protein n=1 Tax=Cohnella kolymensis TaxID=1590652 RepID=A0ABR5A1H1_9BACL|nr:hypothetical protein SD71_16920 [Cohnella kolymensis]